MTSLYNMMRIIRQHNSANSRHFYSNLLVKLELHFRVESTEYKSVPFLRYNERYTSEYNPNAGAFAGASGLATQILLEAIGRCAETGDISRACVRDEVAATDMKTSLLGIPISFGAGNQVENATFFLFQVHDGNFLSLGTFRPVAE